MEVSSGPSPVEMIRLILAKRKAAAVPCSDSIDDQLFSTSIAALCPGLEIQQLEGAFDIIRPNSDIGVAGSWLLRETRVPGELNEQQEVGEDAEDDDDADSQREVK